MRPTRQAALAASGELKWRTPLQFSVQIECAIDLDVLNGDWRGFFDRILTCPALTAGTSHKASTASTIPWKAPATAESAPLALFGYQQPRGEQAATAPGASQQAFLEPCTAILT
jgi:hypothetical protein